MLLREGFTYNDYVDIFDAGPLVSARQSDIITIKESRMLTVSAVSDAVDGEDALIAAGEKATFRAARVKTLVNEDNIELPAEAAAALNLKKGDRLRWVSW